VARNLTATMSRYARDVEAVFTLIFDSGAIQSPVSGVVDLVQSLNVVHVCIIGTDGQVEATLRGLPATDSGLSLLPLQQELRALAINARGRAVFSHLYHDPANKPVFYVVKLLPDGRVGVGVVSTAYLVSLQQSIAFGDHGHAVLVDAFSVWP
jgi:hypothetical protein